MGENAATPWGQARIVDEVVVEQESDGKAFSSLVQLLERNGGESLVRFAYATDGVARRGPVTLRAHDVAELRRRLVDHPALAAALGLAPPAKGGGRRPRAS